jgi:hypothetical protein
LIPLHFCVLLSLAVLLGGCTHNMKVKVGEAARVGNWESSRSPMKVGLVLTPEFCSYSHEFKNMGDTWVYKLGPHLQSHAISLCQQSFQQVVVSTNGLPPAGVDYVLSAEVHRSGYAIGGAKLMFTMLLQWTLRDQANKEVLWMYTADAQAADSPKRVFQALFDQLDAKSYRAFQESPEIKRLCQQTAKNP